MKSLRGGIQKLVRFPQGPTLNVSEVAQFVHMDRPISVAALAARLELAAQLSSIPFNHRHGRRLGGRGYDYAEPRWQLPV